MKDGEVRVIRLNNEKMGKHSFILVIHSTHYIYNLSSLIGPENNHHQYLLLLRYGTINQSSRPFSNKQVNNLPLSYRPVTSDIYQYINIIIHNNNNNTQVKILEYCY